MPRKKQRVETYPPPLMIDYDTVARMLACSKRHVFRMVDDGLIPKPVKLGSLYRWPVAVIDAWVAGGCQPGGSPAPADSNVGSAPDRSPG
jgi:excisionase family DNA binding protein